MRLSVIAPTLNEAENVPRLVEQVGLALGDTDYEILIVDDDSADLTWSVAQKISLTNPRVRALRKMQNPGLGMAVIDGFSAATGDVLACIDADLQHDPSILPRMLDELQKGAEVVVGSRHVDGGSTGEWDWFRRLESWIATRTAQFLLGITLKDPMSGYFLIWSKDFAKVKGQLDGKGFKILLEILAKLHDSQVKEVPYTFRTRTLGESKLSHRVILLYVQQLWRLCSGSRHVSVRFLKSAMVGGVGVFVNLAVMILMLWITKIRDWRASAVACLAANVQNYLLNYFWTYSEGAFQGLQKLKGYLSYVLMSAGGLVVTIGSYAGLVGSVTRLSPAHAVSGASLLFVQVTCQFAAVLLGVRFNYAMNQAFPWSRMVRIDLDVPKTIPESSVIEYTAAPRYEAISSLAPETGE